VKQSERAVEGPCILYPCNAAAGKKTTTENGVHGRVPSMGQPTPFTSHLIAHSQAEYQHQGKNERRV
jgi:hypothetical protein